MLCPEKEPRKEEEGDDADSDTVQAQLGPVHTLYRSIRVLNPAGTSEHGMADKDIPGGGSSANQIWR